VVFLHNALAILPCPVFSSVFSILLDQQSQFLFTKLSVLIVSCTVPGLSPPYSNRHYVVVDREQQGCPVTDNTEESPRPQIWQRPRMAHVQNRWNL